MCPKNGQNSNENEKSTSLSQIISFDPWVRTTLNSDSVNYKIRSNTKLGEFDRYKKMRSRLALVALVLTCTACHALNDGLCKTPPMGFNSWTAYGCGVSEADLLDAASFFTSSGLQAAGYTYVNTDG